MAVARRGAHHGWRDADRSTRLCGAASTRVGTGGCLIGPSLKATDTRQAATRTLERAFAEAGVGEPVADAGVLIQAATGLSRGQLMMDGEAHLGAAAAATLTGLAGRRLAREPVFRILGRRSFWGLDLAVTPAVLDPRPDTETIVATALATMHARRYERLRVLDLGTGSGAILCALLTEWPQAIGLGTDASSAACLVASTNLAAHGLDGRGDVAAGDWASAVIGQFDVVVANPPYVDSGDIDGLEPEVREHDPHLALDGGPGGLMAYRRFCPDLPRLLAPHGVAVVEVGWTQASDVTRLFTAAGLDNVRTHRDYGDRDRAISGWKR